jgi:hypothetical protein
MEADAALLHKEGIELADTGIYIQTLCTDDDSSVRANTKYNRTAYYNKLYGAGNWRKDNANIDWPFKIVKKPDGTEKRVYGPPSQDNGSLNLLCYPIGRYTTDLNHRVRVMLKGIYALKSTAKTIPPGLLAIPECHKIKKYAGLYFKKNIKNLPFDEFCRRAPCMFLHHFNEHSCCDIKWCKVLQSKRTDGVQPTVLTAAYMKRFRDVALDSKTYKAVESVFTPYLTEDHLYQCYHGTDTNKNESLNRKCSATAPKDRYFSGTKTLCDRFNFVIIHDSIGYVKGMIRLLNKLGMHLPLVCPVLEEWAR